MYHVGLDFLALGKSEAALCHGQRLEVIVIQQRADGAVGISTLKAAQCAQIFLAFVG